MSGSTSRPVVTQEAIPLPSEQPLEIDYLQHRHRAYEDAQVAYDKGSKEFVAQPLRTRTISWDFDPPQPTAVLLVDRTESFHKAVEKLKASKKGKKDSEVAAFRFEESKNWGDVVKHVQSAEKKYASDESAGGKIRKFFRKVGDNGKSIQSFVGLLPDGEYKTLCGGLTLILTAMSKHSEIREKMAELMDGLPEDIADTEEYIQIYGGSKLLRQLAEQQYIDIMSTLEYFVEWYSQSTAKHMLDGLIKNSNYAEKCDDLLRTIGKSKLRMEKTRERFAHKRLKMMHMTMLQTRGTVLETHEVVTDSQLGIQRVEVSLEDLKKGEQEKYEEVRKTLQVQADGLNGIRKILADETPNAAWKREVNVLRQKAEEKDKMMAELRDRANAMSYTPKSLAKILKLSLKNDHCLGDIEVVQGGCSREPLEFQLRAQWVAQHPDFLREWYKSELSSLLVVQAHSNYEPLSPVSLLASVTVQELRKDSGVLVLPFFCGVNPGAWFGDGGITTGPMIMCRALLAQILSIKDVDWTGGDDGIPMLSLTSKEVAKLVDGSYTAHLQLACNLITALRRKYRAIFILIDGLDWYDTMWWKDVQKTVRSFRNLIANDETPGVLKVMLSTATHATGWPQRRSHVVTIDIPDEIDEEGDSFETVDILNNGN